MKNKLFNLKYCDNNYFLNKYWLYNSSTWNYIKHWSIFNIKCRTINKNNIGIRLKFKYEK